MTTTAGHDISLEIRRFIKAPCERVFDAWTTPEEILKWFGPDDRCKALSAKVDLRVGGEYRIRAQSEACGGPAEVSGVYREVKRPSRLVYTWEWSDPRLDVGETLVTVEFVDVNGATEVRLSHEGFPSAERRDHHNYGWNGSFDKLEKVLDE